MLLDLVLEMSLLQNNPGFHNKLHHTSHRRVLRLAIAGEYWLDTVVRHHCVHPI